MKLKVTNSKSKRLKKVGFRTRSKTPGGRKIISVGAQLAQRVIDFGAGAQEAAEGASVCIKVCACDTHTRLE